MGDPTRKAILAGLKSASLSKVSYDFDDEGDEDPREPLSVDDVAHAIFLRSGRRGGDFVGREDLFDIAMRELGRYGNSPKDVDFLLDRAIQKMVKDRDLIPANGGYRFPR
jgi:hypothetical protein